MSETRTISTESAEPAAAAPAKRPFDFSFPQGRAFWLALLLLTALCYFGSYYRHGINFRDEGGTVALLAKRLLDGERPFKDVVLGYNVMWFYPIVALFKVTGVSFVALRVYCFALSTITAVLGFLTVERVGRRPWLAYLVGLMLVLVPGMTFKNYMPLMAVGNTFCLVQFALAACGRRRAADEGAEACADSAADQRRTWKWLLIGAAAVGLTYQIRVDVGMFFNLLWLGVIALRGLERGLAARSRALLLAAGPAALLAVVWTTHLPVYLDAKHRGFDAQFLEQYWSWPTKIRGELQRRFGKAAKPAVAEEAKPANRARLSAMKSPADSDEAKPSTGVDTLRRPGLQQLLHGKDLEARVLVVLIYAPMLSFAALIAYAAFQLARGFRSGDRTVFRRPLAALAALGGALTVFPQYFFFRPDGPHLSEFSPSFWTATVSACLLLGAFTESRSGERRRLLPAAVLGILAVHAALYLWYMLPNRWTGTIAARKNRTQLFKSENGVNVYVTKREKEGLEGLLKTVREHSKPTDYLVAYPYHPAINLLTDRRTYEKNVYVDNATRSKNWDAEAIQRIEQFQPAVIVLSEWAINGTEASRFSLWAAKTKGWIQEHYELAGAFPVSSDNFEVYTRKAAK